MQTKRVEVRLDQHTYDWLRLRANSPMRPKHWNVQDEIKEMLEFYLQRDRVNGLISSRGR
jgi:hypothetical protein